MLKSTTIILVIIACLLAVVFGTGSIQITNADSSQPYYFRITLSNIDASQCGTSITSVQLLQQGSWRKNNQTYDGTDFAWNYCNVKFSDMLPISIRIVTGIETITIMEQITNIMLVNILYLFTICSGLSILIYIIITNTIPYVL